MEENSVSDNLQFTDGAKRHLGAISKWVYVMSIIGLIVIIGAIIMCIYDYIFLSNFGDVPSGGGVGYLIMWAMTYFIILVTIFCFLPTYFLFKFSTNLKIALEYDDSDSLETSFKYLKFHYISIVVMPLLCYIAYLLMVMVRFF
ncbi:hypothetical protein ACFFLS_02330 [Flavobacterium procerum]|uniref:Uncharacterized protein n=1 Tax=Flavobacterium procerum TaxID=1455569 RepID=A0ABV6BK97_9FLAO